MPDKARTGPCPKTAQRNRRHRPRHFGQKSEAEVSASEPPKFRPHLRTSSWVAVTSAILRQDLPFNGLEFVATRTLNSSHKRLAICWWGNRPSGRTVPASEVAVAFRVCVAFEGHDCVGCLFFAPFFPDAWTDFRKPVADSSGPFLLHPRHFDRAEVEGYLLRLVFQRHRRGPISPRKPLLTVMTRTKEGKRATHKRAPSVACLKALACLPALLTIATAQTTACIHPYDDSLYQSVNVHALV